MNRTHCIPWGTETPVVYQREPVCTPICGEMEGIKKAQGVRQGQARRPKSDSVLVLQVSSQVSCRRSKATSSDALGDEW